MMGPDFKLTTDRTILRSFDDSDLDDHVAILSDWEVTQWLSTNIPFPYSREDGISFIEKAKANFTNDTELYFSINERKSGQHMGGIKLFSVDKPECEIGYWLGPDFWNKGYASEILMAVIDWLKNSDRIETLLAQTAQKNIGSRKLLEKVGFIHKGLPPKEYSRCGHGSGCSEFYVLNLIKEAK